MKEKLDIKPSINCTNKKGSVFEISFTNRRIKLSVSFGGILRNN